MRRILTRASIVAAMAALAGCTAQEQTATAPESKVVGTSYEAMAGVAAVFRENADGSIEMCVWEVRTSQSQGCTTLR